MRLWASSSSITFDEFVPHVGSEIEVSFGLSLSYIGAANVGQRHGGFPCDLSAFGGAGLVQVPELGRTMTALTGSLFRTDDPPFWRIASSIPLRLLNSSQFIPSLPGLAKDSPFSCEAVGSLYISGREMTSREKVYQRVRLVSFQSLCLKADHPRFGQWFDVQRHSDLGSDPDVMTATVCVAELDLIL